MQTDIVSGAVRPLQDFEIDAVSGGLAFLAIPLFIKGVKIGLAASAGTKTAATIGAAVGIGGATIALSQD